MGLGGRKDRYAMPAPGSFWGTWLFPGRNPVDLPTAGKPESDDPAMMLRGNFTANVGHGGETGRIGLAR